MKRPSSTFAYLLAVPIALWALSGMPAAGQKRGCISSDGTPAAPVPPNRWGALKPLDSLIPACNVEGPFCRDSTSFRPDYSLREPFPPWFLSLDAENGYLFVASGRGVAGLGCARLPAAAEERVGVRGIPRRNRY